MARIDRPHQRSRHGVCRLHTWQEPAERRVLAEVPDCERAFPVIRRRWLTGENIWRIVHTLAHRLPSTGPLAGGCTPRPSARLQRGVSQALVATPHGLARRRRNRGGALRTPPT